MSAMELVRETITRYVPLSEEEWQLVREKWRLRSFERGAMITDIGQVEDWFGIVQEGVQRMFVPHDGEEVCIGFSYGRSWSGVFDSFVTRTPSRFGLQAVTDSELWGLHYDDLQGLYRTVPVLERFGRLILEQLVVGRATREIEQLTLDAEGRYRALLARSPHLVQLVSQKDIASYLRMTPETLSRLRSRVR
jgi:CRP-like cAMP-binding protein